MDNNTTIIITIPYKRNSEEAKNFYEMLDRIVGDNPDYSWMVKNDA